MLNHPEFDDYAEEYGSDLRLPNRLVDWWYELAANTSRLIIRDLVSLPENQNRAKDGNFSFLKTNATFDRAMELGRKRNKWSPSPAQVRHAIGRLFLEPQRKHELSTQPFFTLFDKPRSFQCAFHALVISGRKQGPLYRVRF